MKYLLTLVLLAHATLATAGTLPAPEGPVVLTISGNISNTNGPEGASFDRAMLDALEQRETTASTPWFDGPRDFEGPLATALLEAVGAEGSAIKVVALNDYAAEVPIEDVRAYPVIFATRLNGELMSVRDKGPLFLIYPFDEFEDLFNEVHFGRSVWQITRIEVLE